MNEIQNSTTPPKYEDIEKDLIEYRIWLRELIIELCPDYASNLPLLISTG
jgi:hypothetical protein